MLLTTGASEDTNKMNIYDFAGNLHEWTLAYYASYSPCASRGGSYFDNSSRAPASSRGDCATTSSYDNIGFRPSLY